MLELQNSSLFVIENWAQIVKIVVNMYVARGPSSYHNTLNNNGVSIWNGSIDPFQTD